MITTGPTAHQHLLGARGLHLPEANRRRYSLRIDQHASCVVDRAAAQGGRAIAFGPFDLLPTRRLLLKAGQPVRLGSRALDILIALVERPGELVSKGDLMARVYIGGRILRPCHRRARWHPRGDWWSELVLDLAHTVEWLCGSDRSTARFFEVSKYRGATCH